MSIVHDLPSSHCELEKHADTHIPFGSQASPPIQLASAEQLLQFSPVSFIPLPHTVSVQSLSFPIPQPVGQHPSLFVQEFINV